MTVSTTASVKQYTGNTSTTIFSFPYKVFNSTDFIVTILNSSTLAVTTQVNGGSGTYDYSVTVAADKNSANITFNNAPLSAHKITIERKMSLIQSTDYTPNDPFPAETHEQALDERTLMVQQVQNSYELNTFRFDKNVTDAGVVAINKTVAERGDKFLAFDTAGDLTATQEIGTLRGNWAASTAYAVRDLVKDSSNSNFYICIVAHTSSGSTPVSSNTDVAKWTLIIDAAAAATSATAAAASATTATAQAVIATAKAVLTASDATDTAADLVETAADVVLAEAAKTAAETAYDNFDDRWLGSKSSDPSVDNDGATLLDGAAYFNTSNNVLMVYDLGGTTWNRTTPTSGDQAKINTLSAAAVITDMSILATADIVEDMSILGTADVVTDMSILATSDIVTDMSILATPDIVTDMSILATSDIVTDMSILATSDIVTDMSILGTAAVVEDMSILATPDIVTDMSILGTAAIVEDMSILGTADVVEDMSILATPAIVEDLSILGTAAIVEDLSILGTAAIVEDLETCADNLAGISNFAARYRVDSSDPTGSLDEGDLAYNSTANVLKYYNGSAWVTIVAGSLTDIVQDGSPQLGGNLDTQTYTLSNAALAQGGVFSNPNTVTGNTTVTTAALKNMFMMGQISVNDTYTWTIAGDGVLSII